MMKPFHYHQKLCSSPLLNPRGDSFTPRADKNQNCQKFSKSLKKEIAK